MNEKKFRHGVAAAVQPLADEIAADRLALEKKEERLNTAESVATLAAQKMDAIPAAWNNVEVLYGRVASSGEQSFENVFDLYCTYGMPNDLFTIRLVTIATMRKYLLHFRKFLVKRFVKPAQKAFADFKREYADELKDLKILAAENPQAESLKLPENFWTSGEASKLTRRKVHFVKDKK